MKEFKFLPEALSTDSISSLDIALGSPVSGIAIRFDTHSREIIVDLGYGVMGIIPEDEASIYDFTFPEGRCTPYEISCLIGERVRAIVIGHNEDGFLLLSRKLSMLEAWEQLKENTVVRAIITAVHKRGIFVDIGNGLISYVYINECSTSRCENLDAWFKVGDFVFVKILSKNEADSYIVTASRKEAYPTLKEVSTAVYVDDVVAVKISTKLDGGYFCEYTPGISGIIDTDKELNEGEMVRGVVHKMNHKGLKLRPL